MKPYLMFLEDDDATAYLTLRALKINAFPAEVVRANGGAEPLQHLQSAMSKPTLILLDLKLPKISGIEVLQKIRSTPALQVIPVVILSASNLKQDLENTAQLGITRYIVKPMNFQAFVTEMGHVSQLFSACVGFNDAQSNSASRSSSHRRT